MTKRTAQRRSSQPWESWADNEPIVRKKEIVTKMDLVTKRHIIAKEKVTKTYKNVKFLPISLVVTE